MLQHPVSEEYLKHIGDITVSFSILEETLKFFVGGLIHDWPVTQIITAQLPFRNIRTLLVSLYIERHGKDDDFKTLRKYIIKCGKIEEKRNQIIHSIWLAGDDITTVGRMKATAGEKHGWQVQYTNETAQAFQEFANEIKSWLSRNCRDGPQDVVEPGSIPMR